MLINIDSQLIDIRLRSITNSVQYNIQIITKQMWTITEWNHIIIICGCICRKSISCNSSNSCSNSSGSNCNSDDNDSEHMYMYMHVDINET